MKNYSINILCIFLINVLLFLGINIHQIFFYILLSLFFIIFSLAFRKLLESINNNMHGTKTNHLNSDEVSAEEHPIIKSARQRLGK